MRWKRWEIALGLTLVLMMAIAVPVQTQWGLAKKITRLHVLANSDMPEDQQLKLKVRDAVLEVAAKHPVLDATVLGEMETAADKIIAREGYDYSVTVNRGQYYFDTRVYETFSLPAGKYDSVRVVIGEGEGQNWWCVVYPQLCAGLCEAELKEIAAEAGFDEKEISLICGEKRCIIRFRLADFWGRILHRMDASLTYGIQKS